MTAARHNGPRPVLERVRRPDGSVYVARQGPTVRRESTPSGPAVAVSGTHDLALARRIAEVRWRAAQGDAPMPEGVRVWRRIELGSARGGGTPEPELVVSTGTEARAIPTVLFAAGEGS